MDKKDIRDIYPLSPMQQGMLFHAIADESFGAYIQQITVTLAGDMDIALLEESFNTVIAKYDALKTMFIYKKVKKPMQLVLKDRTTKIYFEDISGLTGSTGSAMAANEKIKYVETFLQKDKERGFDLSKDLLVRMSVFKTDEKSYTVILTFHHIIMDGWSLGIVLNEIFENYYMMQNNQPLKMQAAKPYSDFINWIGQQETGEGLSYWSNYLAGYEQKAEIPACIEKNKEAERYVPYVLGETIFTISNPLVNKLTELAKQKGTTLSTIFQIAWGILLHKYNYTEDAVFGAVVSGRPSEIEGIESMVGLFINTIPVRMNFEHSRTFNEVIEQVQEQSFAATKYNYLPLAKIQAGTALKRDLINNVLVYENFPIEKKVAEAGAEKELLEVKAIKLSEQTNFNFNIYVMPGSEMTVKLTYNNNIYDESQVKRIEGHLKQILQQIAEKPEEKVSSIEILSDQEKEQILNEFNNTRTDYPQEKTIHKLFEEQVKKTPDNTAVAFEENTLTYRQLNTRANQLARALRQKGVKPNTIVGIMVERSLEMIIGIMGILKAGGTYLPISPDYPEERISYMLEDSQTGMILTESSVADMADRIDFKGAKIILDNESLYEEDSEDLEILNKPSDLAYVMYTSGTTGKPKGVMIPHQALTNFLITMSDKPGISSQDKMLAVTTYCFDIAGLELYLPLINGAQCNICSTEKTKDVEKLRQEIKRVKPTIMQATPVTWTMLFQAGWKNEEGVKILCGGEALPERLKQYFINTNSEVWNMFGPTETTIWSTTQQIREKEPITIGKPIANTQIYILDRDLKPAPAGILGELYIAGDGLARGYLNKPELTAERFIRNPFNKEAKIYKTGDLARWLPDGNIEFLGRIDHQVKIRGFRIELGEIESQLTKHQDIQDSVVVVKEHEGIKQLIAYYVRQQKNSALLDPQILRDHLKTTLPGYMIPALFVELESIPLTANEKVDRKELMNRKVVSTRTKEECLPESEIEEKILAIWKDVLNVGNISTEDGFFEVGGDSLSAVVVAEKIKNTLSSDFNVTTLFKYSSIKDISKYIMEANNSNDRETGFKTTGSDISEINWLNDRENEQKGNKSYPDYYQDSLAIIGISCQFPGAKDHNEFWNNLREGKESFKFFSKEELSEFNLPAELINDPNYVPVNSVIEGKDLFDPEFFNISYRDAELMDPQLRLLLLHSWKAMEDAGYVPRQVPDTAVYMSASNNFYQALSLSLNRTTSTVMKNVEQYVAWILAQGGTIPTMVSYKLGLKGPSFFVHSNCSSSLAGVYSAYQSLMSGEVKYALVGGATILALSNLGYVYQSGLSFSGDGHIKAFDASADGMMGGEGVAVVVLKRAIDAVEDGDNIYAILRGIGINNDGADKVGFYAPSVKGQAEVIQKVLDSTGINPESIGYVEAHGTGTKLGDAIEFAALHEVYKKYSNKNQFCGLGSVKTNIGHLDTVAGLAGCIKVALCLSNNEIPPSINYKEPNPIFDLNNSPFYIADKLRKWESNGIPNRAALSSFGIGGTNTHVIFEKSALDNPAGQTGAEYEYNGVFAVPLSAKNNDRLKAYAQELLDFISKPVSQNDVNDINDVDFVDFVNLAELAYTLQVGREAMDSRMILIVKNMEDLKKKLAAVIAEKENIEGCFRGEATSAKDLIQLYGNDQDHKEIINIWIGKRKLPELGKLWVKGLTIDWNKLYGDNKPRRISLPTYQFNMERYWIPAVDEADTDIGSMAAVDTARLIHPLLHQNDSDFEEQRYSSVFSGKEFFLRDHVVNGQKVLPGVAYLEMARAAVERAAGALKEKQTGIKLKNVVWVRPISVTDQPFQVHVGLYPEDNGEISYEIYSEPKETDADLVVYSQGNAVLSRIPEIPVLDLKALQDQCNQKILSSSQCYEAFKATGISYGPGHKGIEAVYIGPDQVLAKLALPAAVYDTKGQFVLHPSLMDSAVQSTIGLYSGDTSGNASLKPSLPFALEELEIFGACTPAMWALIRYSGSGAVGERVQKLDIDICDDQGRVCVRMKAYTSRILDGEPGMAERQSAFGALLLTPAWREQPLAQEVPTPDYAQHLVILCEPDKLSLESITAQMNKAGCLILQSPQPDMGERFQTYAAQVFEEIQGILRNKLKDKVLVQMVVSTSNGQQLCSALAGILKTAQLENPKLIGQLIAVEPGQDTETIIGQLQENSRSPLGQQVRYQDGKRFVAGLREIETAAETMQIPWKDQGVYLITGGAGGLGLIFAQEITRNAKDTTLILTGRSPLGEDRQARLNELEAAGARVIYRQVDVTDKEAVSGLIEDSRQEFGSLNGIIHAAGVIKDNFIIKKNREEFLAVLAPKVTGLVNLDQASQDQKLDFFILFSSTGGSFGNPGQADYATANAFMDAYAAYRNNLAASGRRHGRTLSVNWPLWREGGMRVDEETARIVTRDTGMVPMATQTGIKALYQGLASGETQVLVAEGNPARLRQVLLAAAKPVAPQPEPILKKTAELKPAAAENIPVMAQDLLREKAVNYFKKLLSSVIKLPPHRIEADAPMEKYGIDSIMVTQLTNQLEKTFGSLSKTLFFEYQNIKELTGYFLESHLDQLTALLGIDEKEPAATQTTSPAASQEATPVAEPEKPFAGSKRRSRFAALRLEAQPRQEKEKSFPDIAIIGVSGRYPGARNLRDFWENLRNGKDCITEIPKDRWDHSLYFDEDKSKIGKTYSKWGGFIEGVDQFDPLFFNISPRDAMILDPQERLFLQCVYETLEDAGYTREDLGMYKGLGLEGNVGVYVGVMYEEYQLYGAQEQARGRNIALTGSPSSVANRVSYFCNFHGPSIGLDTMCSSSLTAIHLACHSLQRGGCEMAVAGGVNVSVHPNKYLMLGQGKFVSSKGRCESFGQGGDGYVPGEGVGAVLLKPLPKAIADGDHIYGIIKATALNHGGKTNGYSVPNPNAQTSVIGAALKEAGINPRTISYIEAHGTGTVLGDPIEITGLTKAFQEYTKDKQYCALGSAKSNIGHCESAAGIAAVTKVLLQLKHRQLAPSLHSKTLNPNIDFANTPFVVQQELAEWRRPVVELNGQTREYPRIAGISSFGAGGSNAHVVIEEYIPNQEKPKIAVTSQNPAIIVLSAKNEERLKEHAQQLLQAIQTQQFAAADLADVAYTLQVGREAMEERLALTAVSLPELEEKLKNYLDGQDNIDDLYRGQVKRNKEMLAVFAEDEDMVKTIDAWIAKGKYTKLLDLWVKGFVLDWKKLYSNAKPQRISLPTYPFSRERYWFTNLFDKEAAGRQETVSSAGDTAGKPSVSRQPVELTAAARPAVANTAGKPSEISLRSLADNPPIASKPAREEATAAIGDSANKSPVSRPSVELRTVEKPTVANISAKPSGISLGSLPGYQTLSSKPVNQIQQSITLTSTSLTSTSVPVAEADTIPGKISDEPKPVAHVPTANPAGSLLEELASSLAEALYMQPGDIDVDAKFVDLGMDSIIGVAWVQEINKRHGTSIAATKVYDYPSISEFAEFMVKELNIPSSGMVSTPTPSTSQPSEIPTQAIAKPREQEAQVAAKAMETPAPVNPMPSKIPVKSIQEELAASLAEALYMQPSEIDVDAKFVDLGMDSIIGVAWVQEINKRYGTSIAATKVYDYPSISEFAEFVGKEMDIAGGGMAPAPAPSTAEPGESPAPAAAKPQGQAVESPAQVTAEPRETPAPVNPTPSNVAVESIQEELATTLAEALYMQRSELDIDAKFVDLGMDSIIGVAWVQEINKRYGTSITATKIYDYPSISEFAVFLKKELTELNAATGEANQTPADSNPDNNLQTVLQQVREGTLNIEEADQLLNQYV